MPRPRKSVPSYRLHTRSRQARITVSDHLGRTKEIWLPGTYNSQESLAEYERMLAVLRTNGGKLPPPSHGQDITLNELVVIFTERKVEAEYF
ncbi:MAG: hypothetical protein U0744_14630, partial [Gemmataceae bacterium]